MSWVPILIITYVSFALFLTNSIFANSELPPVYQGPNSSFDKYSYTWNDQVQVRIISPISNVDPTIPDVIKTIDKPSTDSEIYYSKTAVLKDYSIVETGPDTGIFSGNFQIVKPSANRTGGIGHDNYLEVDSGDEYIAVFFDNPIEITGPIAHFTYHSDPTPPDTPISNFTAPEYPNIQFRWMESNTQDGGIGKIRVEYPAKNVSEKTADSFVIRLVTPYHFGIAKYVSLTESGQNTGMFEGMVSVVSYQSPTKLTVTPDESLPVSVAYPIDDGFTYVDGSYFRLYASTEQHLFAQKSNDAILAHIGKKAYFPDQLMSIYGKAEPNEELDVEISRRAGPGVQTEMIKYSHVKSDSSGSFNATLKLPDSPITSAQYVVKIAGNKHDDLTEKYIVITSLEDMRSYVVDVSPKQQLAMGIAPNEIVCPRVWDLVLKPDGKSSVCLEQPTTAKLVERGWTIID